VLEFVVDFTILNFYS